MNNRVTRSSPAQIFLPQRVEVPSLPRNRSSYNDCARKKSSWCPGDGDVFLLCGQIAHPFGHRKGPTQLRWHQTCQGGTRRTERTNKPSTEVESPTQWRTARCARFFKNEHDKTQSTHKTEFGKSSAPPLVINYLKTKPSDWTRISTCLWAESASDQMRFSTRANTFILKISDSEATVRHLLEDHPESV